MGCQGGRDLEPGNEGIVMMLEKAKKKKKTSFFVVSKEKGNPVDTLTSVLFILDCDVQNYEVMHF